MKPALRIGIVGGGIGGLTAAIALSQRGFKTHIFEQSRELAEIGACISLTPNECPEPPRFSWLRESKRRCCIFRQPHRSAAL